MGMNSPLIQQAMENELPKIDLPEDLITGRLTDTMILNLYAHFPCRIKAEIFVLCRKGEVDASINLKHYHVGDNCFLILLPGTVFQINRIEGDVDIYFGGVSSDFLRSVQPIKSVIDVSYAIKRNPCVVLRPEAIEMAQSYFETVHKSKEVFGVVSRDVLKHLYYSLMYMLNKLYKNRKVEKENLTQNERTAQDFGQQSRSLRVRKRGCRGGARKDGAARRRQRRNAVLPRLCKIAKFAVRVGYRHITDQALPCRRRGIFLSCLSVAAKRRQ